MLPWHAVYNISEIRTLRWKTGGTCSRHCSNHWSWNSSPDINNKMSYTCWAPTMSQYSSLYVLTNLNFAAILKGKYYYYLQFTDYKTHSSVFFCQHTSHHVTPSFTGRCLKVSWFLWDTFKQNASKSQAHVSQHALSGFSPVLQDPLWHVEKNIIYLPFTELIYIIKCQPHLQDVTINLKTFCDILPLLYFLLKKNITCYSFKNHQEATHLMGN